jgi:hypothetical protein
MFHFREKTINELFHCPITREEMTEPVLLVGDGHTYEQSAITYWLAQGNRISPMTGARLEDIRLVQNHKVRSLKHDFEAIVEPYLEMQSVIQMFRELNTVLNVLREMSESLQSLQQKLLDKQVKVQQKRRELTELENELKEAKAALGMDGLELYQDRKKQVDDCRRRLHLEINRLRVFVEENKQQGEYGQAVKANWQLQIAEAELSDVDRLFIDLKVEHHSKASWMEKARRKKSLKWHKMAIADLEEEIQKIETVYEETCQIFFESKAKCQHLFRELSDKGFGDVIGMIQNEPHALNDFEVRVNFNLKC